MGLAGDDARALIQHIFGDVPPLRLGVIHGEKGSVISLPEDALSLSCRLSRPLRYGKT